MPMKLAVLEMLPEKRRIWTRRYSRSKFSRASRSGTPISDALPLSPASGVLMISVGSMSLSIRASRPRGARIIVRSTTLRNWRTLPGQS